MIKIFGDTKFRGKCPKESVEQITFVNLVRNNYPEYGNVLVHPENEGKLINGQFSAINKQRAMGLTKGAADIIIPAKVPFVCEMKRIDSSRSKPTQEQIKYLEIVDKLGAFACICYGHIAAMKAFKKWLTINNCHDTIQSHIKKE